MEEKKIFGYHYQYNPVLLAVILLGFLATLFINYTRYEAEQKNTVIDLVADYEDLVTLANMEGQPLSVVLKQAKDAGITSLAVYETTFKKFNLNGQAHLVTGGELLNRYETGSISDERWKTLCERNDIEATELYITAQNEITRQELKEDLENRLGKDRVRVLGFDGHEVFAIQADYKLFEKMDLGLSTQEMQLVNNAGFFVLARPSNYTKVNDEQIEKLFARLENFDISEIVFSRKEVLGANEKLDDVAQRFLEKNYTLGMIEAPTQLQFFQQEGLLALAEKLNYRAARVYSIPKDEQEKMKVEQAVARWLTTDEERNIRINLLRIFEKPMLGETLLETNMRYFKGVHDSLAQKGFSFGKASFFDPFPKSNGLYFLIFCGVSAAVVLYLSLLFPAFNRRSMLQCLIAALGAIVLFAPLFFAKNETVRLMAALISANIFPALAMISFFDVFRQKREWFENLSVIKKILVSLVSLCAASFISMMGAFYLSGALSDVTYFLEVNIFRGVKITFLMPIILVAVAFLQRFDLFGTEESFKEQVQKILDTKISVKMLVFFMVAAIAMIVFIARSGHNMGMPVAGIELKFRAFLEQNLYARPRSKELLIGHPAFWLMMFVGFQMVKSTAHKIFSKENFVALFFVLALVATIGQGSMVETFAHMRTPFLMSFVRGIGGIIGGTFFGCFGLLFLTWLDEKFLSQKINFDKNGKNEV